MLTAKSNQSPGSGSPLRMSATTSTPGAATRSELTQPYGVIGPQPQCKRRGSSAMRWSPGSGVAENRLAVGGNKGLGIARPGTAEAAIRGQALEGGQVIEAGELALVRPDR